MHRDVVDPAEALRVVQVLRLEAQHRPKRPADHLYHWHEDLDGLSQHHGGRSRHARIREQVGDDAWCQRGCPAEPKDQVCGDDAIISPPGAKDHCLLAQGMFAVPTGGHVLPGQQPPVHRHVPNKGVQSGSEVCDQPANLDPRRRAALGARVGARCEGGVQRAEEDNQQCRGVLECIGQRRDAFVGVVRYAEVLEEAAEQRQRDEDGRG
mmetsp:Transcript_9145/g.30311  ORF Transcript_9145/g.30311 Transcript_9145/m.30311 type:complete len:209 (+) Transcript_9145:452-1078(+)